MYSTRYNTREWNIWLIQWLVYFWVLTNSPLKLKYWFFNICFKFWSRIVAVNLCAESWNPSTAKFKEDINNIVDKINDWFRGNSLSFYFDKTYCLQFRPKNCHEIYIKISCDKLIQETKSTKFLGLDIDSSLLWNNHIVQMMFKLSRACYAIRYVKYLMSQETLRAI